MMAWPPLYNSRKTQIDLWWQKTNGALDDFLSKIHFVR